MSRPDQTILATARLIENLASLVPQVRQHVRRELALMDSLPSSHVGAGTPVVEPSKPMTEKCTANIISPYDPDELIDCGIRRPCPEHDRPVKLTATERAADARMALQNWLADIEAQCKLIAITTHDALTSGRKLIGERAPVAVRRCSAEGRDGAIEWADPTCADVPSRGPLCDRCSKREYRWRQAHQLPTRDDGVFAAAGHVPSG